MTIKATTNDITGDEIRTHYNSKEYVEGWERIWGHQEEKKSNLNESFDNDDLSSQEAI